MSADVIHAISEAAWRPIERERIPLAAEEQDRIETLRQLKVNDDILAQDPLLNSMCKTVSQIFDVPIAGVSIVQDDKLKMKASAGLEPEFCCPRQNAMCAWTLLPKVPEVLVIEDMSKDPRFDHNPLVHNDAGLRFYAGAPLIASNGHRLGSVCMLDRRPRKLAAEHYSLLSNFSEMAVRRLEETAHLDLKRKGGLLRTEEEVKEPILLVEVTTRHWNILYANAACQVIKGMSTDEIDHSFWRVFRPAANAGTKSQVLEAAMASIAKGDEFTINVSGRSSYNDAYVMRFRPATKANLGKHSTAIGVPSIVDAANLEEKPKDYYFAVVKEGGEAPPAPKLAKKAKANRQETFTSKPYKEQQPVSSKQPKDEGMHDVTLGVLCASGPDGLVYRGRWKKKPVACKVIEKPQSECLRAPNFGTAYVPYEAAVTVDLYHPNVVTTYKFVVEQITAGPDNPNIIEGEKVVLCWLVREWCSRGTLAEALTRGWLHGPDGLPKLGAVLAVAHEVASAMVYLHQEGIIHGDLNPDTVALVDDKNKEASQKKDFIAKVTDFSHSIASQEPLTTANPGTATHAAPETLAKLQVSPASDVYAFGMLLWEIYCGQRVWLGLNFSQIQRRVVAAKEQPALPKDALPAYKELMSQCLASKPSMRPTFADIADRLRQMQDEDAEGALPGAMNSVGIGAAGKAKNGLLRPSFLDKKESIKSKMTRSLSHSSRDSAISTDPAKATSKAKKPSLLGKLASRFK